MDYIKTNKEAWEEAFENRQPIFGDDNKGYPLSYILLAQK